MTVEWFTYTIRIHYTQTKPAQNIRKRKLQNESKQEQQLQRRKNSAHKVIHCVAVTD